MDRGIVSIINNNSYGMSEKNFWRWYKFWSVSHNVEDKKIIMARLFYSLALRTTCSMKLASTWNKKS